MHNETVPFPVGPPSCVLIVSGCCKGCVGSWRYNAVIFYDISFSSGRSGLREQRIFFYASECLIKISSTNCWQGRSLERLTTWLFDGWRFSRPLITDWLPFDEWDGDESRDLDLSSRSTASLVVSSHVQRGSTWCPRSVQVLVGQ